MTTLQLEGAGSQSGAEGFSPALLGTPDRVAATLHLAIGSFERGQAAVGRGEGAIAIAGAEAYAWRRVDGDRHLMRVEPAAGESGSIIHFRSSDDQERPALEIGPDGEWQMGEARGEIEAMGELLADPRVRAEALALFGTADAVLAKSRAGSPPPIGAS